jgi:peptidoglycan/xylan/chitin deacetylase (PgdA/CDA1 family)
MALHPAWWPGLAATVAGNHLVLGAAGMWPRSQWVGPAIHRLPAAAPAAALTFDDGPDPAVTPRVLDLLAAAGAHATFFCIGERARANPALVRQIIAAGHAVANHTLTHPLAFAFHPPSGLRREVERAQAVLADITGHAPRWFRAPMGVRSPLLDPVLHRAGLHQVTWTRRGYDTRCRDPALVLRRLVRGLSAGDVLVMHDGNGARMPDGTPLVLRVLPEMLAALAARGLTGVALPPPAYPSGLRAAAPPGPAAAAETRSSAGHAST